MNKDHPLILITPDAPTPEVNQVLDIIHAKGIDCEAKTSSEYTKALSESYDSHDALTGLPNRMAFQIALENFIIQAKLNNVKIALIKINIDNFAVLNELYTHRLGDAYLQYVSRMLQTLYPAIDFVARIDGNEFGIIINAIQNQISLSPVILRINSIFTAPYSVDGHTLSTTVSIGISVYPDVAHSAEGLIRTAYRSLRHAQTLGGGRVQFDDIAFNKHLDKELVLAHDMQAGIARGEFYLMYQPQTYIDSQKLSGFEVLLRWKHPLLGEISPADFIVIAEKIGLITHIGRWVFEQSIMQYAEWLNQYYELMNNINISINFSPLQLREPELLEWVSRTLSQYNVPTRQVMIELTETAILTDLEYNIMVIQGLRDLGLGVAVDDFGTGYSSLTFLGKLPITQLKIDQSFIRSVSVSSKSAAIVKALILLSDALGIEVVAEGVETEQELKYLRDNTCGVVQGYYYSKPLLPKDMALYIQNHA